METRDFYPEFVFATARSGGAGGQNVNKVETKVELRFAVEASALLTDAEKARLREKLANQLSHDGWLRVVAQAERTQLRNKQLCVKKFYQLLARALAQPRPRRATQPSAGAVRARLTAKRKNAATKASRRPAPHPDDGD